MGSKHRGGLVKDEDIGLAIQHLEDFYPLLLPNGDFLDPSLGIDVQSIPLGYFPQVANGLIQVQPPATPFGLLSGNDVFSHGQAIGQHEVLVDHAQVVPEGIRWAGNFCLLAMNHDPSLVLGIQAKENLHEGSLARAVFPEETVNLPLFHLQVNAIIGDDVAKPLSDVFHLHCDHRQCSFPRRPLAPQTPASKQKAQKGNFYAKLRVEPSRLGFSPFGVIRNASVPLGPGNRKSSSYAEP